MLYIPGTHERALEKAAGLDADALILDLEDSPAPAAKAVRTPVLMWQVGITAGARGPEHAFDCEQAWTVLEGELTVTVAGEHTTLRPVGWGIDVLPALVAKVAQVHVCVVDAGRAIG